MARTIFENSDSLSKNDNDPEIIRIDNGNEINVPSSNFISNSDLSRDGQDLILEHNGETIIIENYFNADPAPVISSPEGAVLTPDLVESFVQQKGPLNYAESQSALNDESPVGNVNEVSGQATVIRVDGSEEVITSGTTIFQGDVIETAVDGAVNIVFIDDSSFAVSENAKLAIDEYVFDPQSESGSSNFSILRGIFVFTSGLIGRDDPDDVEIDTPVGSIGIRGTIIAGRIDPSGESQITVIEGAIVVRNNDGEQTLSEQYETVSLSGFNAEIRPMGIMNADDIGQSLEPLKAVAPDFFSSVEQGNDIKAAKEAETEKQSQSDESKQETSQEQTELAAQDTDPEDQPDLMGDPDTSFDGGQDTGFGDNANNQDNDLIGSNNTQNTGQNQQAGGQAPVTGGPGTPPPHTNTDTQPPPPGVLQPPATGGSDSPTGPLLLNTLGGVNGFTINGTAGEQLGNTVSTLGDFDNNGFIDFLVGNNVSASGQIFVYDDTGTIISNEALPPPSSDAKASSIGDFDGDGQIDYIISAPNANGGTGYIEVVLQGGGSGSIFFNVPANFALGESISGLGDIDGDGFHDLIVGAPGANGNDGESYVIFGAAVPPSIYDYDDTSPANGTPDFVDSGDGMRFQGATGFELGSNVSAAGDFDNDGYNDFMTSVPGNDTVILQYGDNTNPGTGQLIFQNIDVDPTDTEIPIFDMGDINGDGQSDIAIASTGENAVYMIFGGSFGTGNVNLDNFNASGSIANDADSDGIPDPLEGNAGFKITTTAGTELVGGGSAGDFNGDGISDGVFAVRNGDQADIFIIYGDQAVTGIDEINLNNLIGQPEHAFHMVYDLSFLANPATDPFDFELANAGDLDGDGFDDLLVGTPDANNGDGAFSVVHGREDEDTAYHIAGVTTPMNDVIANGDHQALVGNQGNNVLNDNGFNDIGMNGGDGSDALRIQNDNFTSLDGGMGIDKIEVFGAPSIDFASLGSEAISNIEKFGFMEDNQTMTIGIDDIFRLMQQSEDIEAVTGGARTVLKFADIYELMNGSDSNNTTLNIEDNGIAGGFSGFGFVGNGTFNDAGVTYDVHNFGSGYALLIDQNIENVNVV